jgi:predicted 3-demethylubiquinone-9 3-methyltransferase (glyoxalase superfamily)
MQKIVTYLWFDGQAEEAAALYTSLFKDSKIVNVSRYDEGAAQASGRPVGSAMTVAFELGGQEFLALNGGPQFKFTEAISLLVNCESQAEVDRLWEALCDGGEPGQCGWLKDRYGLSWQIVPTVLGDLIGGPDAEGAQRAVMAMLQMQKLDVATLQKAYNGE